MLEVYGYTVDFAGIEKGILIELKKHVRTYQRKFLKDEDYPTPKIWSDKKIITFPSWNRDHIESSIKYAFSKMGPKFKLPKYEVRIAEKDEVRDNEELAVLEEAQQIEPAFRYDPKGVPELFKDEGISDTVNGKYRLLITPEVRDALSDIDPQTGDKIIEFLTGLIFGKWEDWIKEGKGVNIWHQNDNGIYLFTKEIPGFGLAIWESLLTVDIISTIYSSTSEKTQYPSVSRFAPHVVLHEFRQMEEKPKDVMSFQSSFYEISADAINALSLENKNSSDLDGMELYQLSPARVTELIDGEDIALPLHLTETQLEPLLSNGPILLGGEAGSGKSSVIVLWLTINHIRNYSTKSSSDQAPRQLFVTYSSRLRDKARQDFERMLPHKYKNHRTEFRTFREILEDQCILSGKIGLFQRDKEVKFELFVRKFGKSFGKKVDPVLLWDEIRGTIKGGSVEDPSKFLDLQAYQILSEKKGKSKVPQRLRENYYDEAQSYQAFLQKEGLWDQLDMVSSAIDSIKTMPYEKYDRIACDEVQDLAPTEIYLLLLLVSEHNVNKIFLTGDEAQVINPSGFKWSRLKGDLGNLITPWPVPEVITFRQNYRSSSQIVELINAVLEVRRYLLDDGVSKVKQKSKVNSKASPMILLNDPIKVLMETETNPDKRLVLVKTQDQKTNLLKTLGNKSESVSILTVEEAKGLEWDGVLLYNFFIPRNEVLTSNDWNDTFDLNRRELLRQDFRTDTRSPYGLTYEFNLLHVGLTRARSFLAIFDKDPKMQLKKLGDPIPPTVAEGGIESFKGYWETKVATADDYRRLGLRLIDHDTEQAHRFFTLAAERYLSDNKFESAAESFEYALNYDKAANCYQQVDDRLNELRFRSKAFEYDNKPEQAGDKMLELSIEAEKLSKPYQVLVDACDNGSRLFGLAEKWDKQSKALELKCNAYPHEKHNDRAEALDQAANIVCQKVKNYSECVRLTKSAIKELDPVGLGEGSKFSGHPISEWIAERKIHLAEHLEKLGDLKGAAKEAEASYKLYKSAADLEKPTSSFREGYFEHSANVCAKCIDYSLDAKDYGLAIRARQDLEAIVKHRDNIEQIRRWWNVWIERYRNIDNFEEYAESTIQLAGMLADRKLYHEAVPILRESYRQNMDKMPIKISVKLLNELVRISYIYQPSEEYNSALILRGTFFMKNGDYAKAFEDLRTSGEQYALKGNIPGSRDSFNQALSCAELFMQSVAVGKFCLYDVGINVYAVNRMSKSAFEWVEKSSGYFLQDHQKGKEEIKSLINRIKGEPENNLKKGWLLYGESLFYNELSKSGITGDFYNLAVETANEAIKIMEKLDVSDVKEMKEKVSKWIK